MIVISRVPDGPLSRRVRVTPGEEGPSAAETPPVPLAAIHSTSDEFVPESDVRKLMARASEPKRLWMVTASDHRFSGNVPEFDRRLLESIEWVRQNQPRA